MERPGRLRRARSQLWRQLRQANATVRESGQALVEFALILPLMLVLIFALVDFGRGFYTWLVVTNAAREGARVAATQRPATEVVQRINDAIGGLESSQLSITLDGIQEARGTPVEVDLVYDFEFVTPMGDIINILTGGSLDDPEITAHASMRLE